MRMALINLISEEIFYRIITTNKTADIIRDTFNFGIDDHINLVFNQAMGTRMALDDMERHMIRDDVRKRLFGDDK